MEVTPRAMDRGLRACAHETIFLSASIYKWLTKSILLYGKTQ